GATAGAGFWRGALVVVGVYDWVGLVSSVDELVKPVLSATPMTATTARAVPAIPAPEICLPLTDGPRPASVAHHGFFASADSGPEAAAVVGAAAAATTGICSVSALVDDGRPGTMRVSVLTGCEFAGFAAAMAPPL